MRTQAHRIVDTDPKRGNVVVRVTGTRHDEPTYQVRQSLPNTQEVPGHDHHTNRVREPGQAPTGLSCDLYPLTGSHSTWTDPRGPVTRLDSATRPAPTTSTRTSTAPAGSTSRSARSWRHSVAAASRGPQLYWYEDG
jgi:hypothetical protein